MENLKIAKTATHTEYTEHPRLTITYMCFYIKFAIHIHTLLSKFHEKQKFAKWNEYKNGKLYLRYDFSGNVCFRNRISMGSLPLYLIFLSFVRCFFHFNVIFNWYALTFNGLVWEWNVSLPTTNLNSVKWLFWSLSEGQRALWNVHRTSMFIVHRHRIFCQRTKINSAF